MKIPFFLCLVVSLAFNTTAFLQPTQDNNYRAAKYSFTEDYSKYIQAMPELYMMPESTISYAYYVQYGKDTLFELLDPGEIKSLSGWITTFDYSKNVSTNIAFSDQTRTYFVTKDSLRYSIEESRGIVTNLCDVAELNSRCDSVTFLLRSNNDEYKLFFNDTSPNLRSTNLFFPDIKYLPYKIIRMGRRPVTFNLEEVIYGKPAIDSLLCLYEFESYLQITDDDINPTDRQTVLDLLEKLKCIEEK